MGQVKNGNTHKQYKRPGRTNPAGPTFHDQDGDPFFGIVGKPTRRQKKAAKRARHAR